MNISHLVCVCMYSKSKNAVGNLDHVISSYRWMTMQSDMLHPEAIHCRAMHLRNKSKTKNSIELSLEETVTQAILITLTLYIHGVTDIVHKRIAENIPSAPEEKEGLP